MSLNGPVPNSRAARALRSASPSRATIRALGTLTVSGKIENGARIVKRTVCLSTASTLSMGPTSPR